MTNVTTRPQRIQRKRTKGWRMPPGAVYVGRGTQWGNPFRVGPAWAYGEVPTREEAVKLFRNWWFYPAKWALPEPPFNHLHQLRGRDLACWCLLDAACHADVLLELANS